MLGRVCTLINEGVQKQTAPLLEVKDAIRDLSELIERQLIPVNGDVDQKLLTITGKLDSIKTALTSLGQLGPIATSIQALATQMKNS